MAQKRFTNKVVTVTGSARGIGKNILRAFAREGASVIISDFNQELGYATEKEFQKEGLNARFLEIDLSQKGTPNAMIQKIIEMHGKIDILVNNARSGKRLGVLEETEETWDFGLSVTLKAAFFSAQEAIRSMSKTGGGAIVNISSIAGFSVCKESPSYHIAKAGMMQMTRYLAVNAGQYGVRVNAVLPGFIVQDEHQERYSRNDNQSYRDVVEFCHPLGNVGQSDDIARTVLFLCSPEATFISGECITVDGGVSVQDQSTLLYRFDGQL
ncbi:SDR family NAD(P)-dependent oxidoreductase [Lusitaniella coriacea]|uniref:SDR family NAD(P)-dependent oxidoreductase n=1 Tax=Lusitaniella coriacea TaxID=1983105 RepID=UPI003CED5B0C